MTANEVSIDPGVGADMFQLNLDGQQVTSEKGFGSQPRYSQESIAEFQFVSNRFDATMGRSAGVQVVAITDAAGDPQGFVLEDELWAIPAEQRPWVMLTQLMVPVDSVARAAPDEDLTAVLPRLNPARPIVTVWQEGKLVGMVPPRRLRDRIAGAGARLGIV